MFPQSRLLRRRLCLVLLSFIFTWIFLPYDNTLVLQTRSHAFKIKQCIQGLLGLHAKVLMQGKYPVSPEDIGLIIKTGYSTRERLSAKLQTLGLWNLDGVVVVSDYETEISILDGDGESGRQMQVHDALAGIMSEEWVDPNSRRVKQYREFSEAVKNVSASNPVRHDLLTFGWELDIVKHISAFEHAFANLPYKRWYLMTDDDTYVHAPSLLYILSHLSSKNVHYIGNPISTVDSPLRFAHGGSGILFSHAALSHIFSKADLIQQMKNESLSALYGDKILGKLAMKRGIYVNEELGIHFSYDPPAQSRITQKNGCAVLVNFHRVATPTAQLAIYKLFSKIETPITWWDVWRVYGRGISDVEMRVREGWNYVGHIEIPVPQSKVENHVVCMALCLKQGKECLAWEWDSMDKECRMAPWVTIGFKAKGKISGVNIGEVTKLADECPVS